MKAEPIQLKKKLKDVAHLVGAWIERNTLAKLTKNENVAPLVGAWIESFLGEYNYHFPQSLLL